MQRTDLVFHAGTTQSEAETFFLVDFFQSLLFLRNVKYFRCKNLKKYIFFLPRFYQNASCQSNV